MCVCVILHSLAIDCGLLSNPVNGVVSLGSTAVGSVAAYQCNTGFTLSGDSLRQCQDVNGVGVWSGAAPICIGISLHMQKKKQHNNNNNKNGSYACE